MRAKARTIDANVILRFLLNDNPSQAERCSQLLQRVESGAEQVFLPDLVMAEVVWTLEKFYRQPKARIRELLVPILLLRGMRLSSKSVARKALDWYVGKNIDWTDAFVAAKMASGNRAEIYSYDRHFDRLLEIKRIEP